ncbi:splicing factor 3A subunit 2-like [Penaeus monodon]|uniref:splicing factor 3A subunit 2-like n=1 Tax=Penaeus monodon TaxID=6687 RepID=UPI0018A75F25|nr:splicing factor 3A subunit 2-like [Penaeus monodon]
MEGAQHTRLQHETKGSWMDFGKSVYSSGEIFSLVIVAGVVALATCDVAPLHHPKPLSHPPPGLVHHGLPVHHASPLPHIAPVHPDHKRPPAHPHSSPVYTFDHAVRDDAAGTHFGHSEARDGYKTEGKYFVHLPDGRVQTVTYHSDENGFHPTITYEGLAHHESHVPPHHTPTPAYHITPTPGYHTPTPGYHPPTPSYHPPTPGYHPPTPGYHTTPTPAYHATPTPGYYTPTPAYHGPEPAYQAPRPGYHAPTPGYYTPSPEYLIPRSYYGKSTPTYGTFKPIHRLASVDHIPGPVYFDPLPLHHD